ncbi:MAG: polysaccharide deacetylase family protein [Sedimentisphaerales bacterium]|nr:polysaccharide deacetylase family protein [Sedimentisphaerales bacterium]
MSLRYLAKRMLKLALLGLVGVRSVRGVAVLAYHSVDKSGSWLSISPEQFREHLQWLKDHQWEGLTIEQYLSRLDGKPGANGAAKEVLITFDDGYENFLTNAVPVLKEMGFPATVFVVTDLVGKRAEWYEKERKNIEQFVDGMSFPAEDRLVLDDIINHFSQERLMDWEQLAQLKEYNIDVESHSSSHQFLSKLSPAELSTELERSQSVFQEKLGRTSRIICYPYGDYSSEVGKAAEAAGFEAGFIVSLSGDKGANWRFKLGRVGINGFFSKFDLRFALSRAAVLHQRIRRWLFR